MREVFDGMAGSRIFGDGDAIVVGEPVVDVMVAHARKVRLIGESRKKR